MRALIEMYRRYFKSHLVGLLLAGACWLAVVAEGSIMAAMSRYLIDNVLQIDLTEKVVTHGRPGAFVSVDGPLTELPDDHAVGLDQLVDGSLPGEAEADPLVLTDLPADGSLQDRMAARPGRPTGEKLKLLALIAVFLVMVHLIAVGSEAWSTIKISKVTEQAVFVMRRHLHDKLLRLQLSFHDRHQTGRLLSRAVDDVQAIEDYFVAILRHFGGVGAIVIINVSIMYYISPRLATISLLAMPFYAAAYAKFGNRIRDLSRTQRKRRGALYGLTRDRLANPRVVKSFGQEQREITEFFRRTKDLFRRQRWIVLYNNLLGMFSAVISALVVAVVLGYGIILLQRGQLTLGYLLFFYTVSYGLFYPIAAMTQLTAEVQRMRASCERILEVLDEPITIVDHPRAKRLDRLSDSISIENVTFQFVGADRHALDNVTLRIARGLQICLMGKSGAGKSTLAMLLLRLYDPTAGRITIDGLDLRKVKTSSLRKRISYVSQEPILFSGTLASNILYGNPRAGRDQMIAAARSAEMHTFIESLPDGYDTVIGENGLRLSGGQKQRVSLARALINDPDILVLDDCTSALDAETEARIQNTLKTTLVGKTVIIISHRVSVASNSDTVVVLDAGKIVEEGTHHELMTAEGHYWNLVRDQLEEQTSVTIDRARVATAVA